MITDVLVFVVMVAILATGLVLGWLLRGQRRSKPGMPADPVGLCTREKGHEGPCNGYATEGCLEFADDTEAGFAISGPIAGPPIALPQRAENPVQRKTETAIFYSDGYPLPVRKAWGDVAYDELSPMFLDQFLLRYFHELMTVDLAWFEDVSAPWLRFIAFKPWAKDMPLLFEQLTGYKLNELQLNNAIAEYVRRLQKNAAKEQAKIQTPPGTEFANG